MSAGAYTTDLLRHNNSYWTLCTKISWEHRFTSYKKAGIFGRIEWHVHWLLKIRTLIHIHRSVFHNLSYKLTQVTPENKLMSNWLALLSTYLLHITPHHLPYPSRYPSYSISQVGFIFTFCHNYPTLWPIYVTCLNKHLNTCVNIAAPPRCSTTDPLWQER